MRQGRLPALVLFDLFFPCVGAGLVDNIWGVLTEVGKPAITLVRLFFRPTASC